MVLMSFHFGTLSMFQIEVYGVTTRAANFWEIIHNHAAAI